MDESEDTAELEEAPRQRESARRYLQMIEDGQKAFEDWQTRSDNIEARFASLKTLADVSGDREMQMFWANMEVMRPTIYQRAPQPVVQQRFRGRDPVPREAAQMLERALTWDVEADGLHETLLMVRDDMALSARGVPWVLDNGSCIHVDRHDFVHEPARKWSEVGWVARRAYLDREAFRERFPDADISKAKFEHRDPKDDGDSADYKTTARKAAIWELWHKGERLVCWVTEGCDEVLDESDPLIDVSGFFPCPRPAYGTLEPRTLKPVPDFVYVRDQLDEINELTARISSLSESLRLKGFYASGASEVGEAIEAAMKATDNKAVLVPVSNFAALGGGSLKDAIVWLPVREVAEVITALVALRKQLIEDVYEVSGISDIMRGQTAASETATAQNLKAQYGSVRVRERQNEMVRVARDVIRIKAEVYAEQKPVQELAEMAQMQLPAMADVQMAMQQGQQVDPNKIVTLEQIDGLLKNQRLRPFVLEVESDSTIAPNEAEEKQSRTEFVTAMGGFIQSAGAMVQQQPQTAKFAVEMMKFAAGAFRAGREMDAALDEFAETVEMSAAQALQQRGQPSPEQQQMEADAQARHAELAIKQQDMQAKAAAQQAELALKAQEMELRRVEMEFKAQELAMKRECEMADRDFREREMARSAENDGYEREMRGRDMDARAKKDMIDRGLPEDYSFADHQQQMAELAERVAAGEARTAEAMAMLAETLERVMDAVTAPRRLIKGADGSVQGVEIMAAKPMRRDVERDGAGEVTGVDRLN